MRGVPAGARSARTRAVLTVLVAALLLWPCLAGAAQAREPDGTGSTPATGTESTSTDPAGTNPAWAPYGEFAGRLSFELTDVVPAVVTATAGDTLTVTARMTNNGPDTLAGLTARFQRGEPAADLSSLQDRIDDPEQPIAVIQAGFTDLQIDTLEPGASADLTLTAPLTGTVDGGLDLRRPGVYPVMVNVNGEVRTPDETREARVGELHVLLTVLSVPAPPADPDLATDLPNDPAAAPEPADPVPVPVPVDLTWPLVDRPHLGVGGVFLDDDLIGQISPGGRLWGIADAVAASTLPAGSATLVVDPRLLDEVDRMTRDYRVLAPGTRQQALQPVLPQTTDSVTPTAGATEPATGSSAPGSVTPSPTAASDAASSTGTAGPGTLLPTTPPEGPVAAGTNTTGTTAPTASTAGDPGQAAQDAGTVAGQGTAAARRFLDLLRDIAGTRTTVVLPYSDPDVVALVEAGLDGQLTRSVTLGREVAERVLADPTAGSSPPLLDTTTTLPPTGTLDEPTAAALMAAGYTAAVLSPTTLSGDGAAPGTATVDVPARGAAAGGTLPVVVTDTQVLPDGAPLAAAGRGGGWASRLNVMTAVLAQRSLDGTDRTPTVIVPDRTTELTVTDLARLAGVVDALAGAGAVTGAPLSTLIEQGSQGSPPAAATLAYPEAAREAQLSTGYLNRLTDLDAAVTSAGSALLAPEAPGEGDPTLLLDPLRQALDVATSSTLRDDLAPGVAVLDTVEATLTSVHDGVGIVSSGSSYTLASSSSPLVVTLRNTLPYRVQVGVRLTGGQVVGLTATDPGTQTLLPGRSLQVPVQTQVSRVGSFVVTSRLISPDGRDWGQPVPLPVRSTAYGAFTVIIVAVAGAVLLLMVVFRIRQRVRDRRARLAAEAAALVGEPAPPDPADRADPANPANPADPTDRHRVDTVAAHSAQPSPTEPR